MTSTLAELDMARQLTNPVDRTWGGAIKAVEEKTTGKIESGSFEESEIDGFDEDVLPEAVEVGSMNDPDPVDFIDLESYLDAYDRQQTGAGYDALQKVYQQRRSALDDVPTGDLLSRYMLETNRQRLLTAEEEVDLARRIKLGHAAARQLGETTADIEEIDSLRQLVEQGEAARALLVRSNTRLVISIAKRYFGQGLDFLDLIQEGNIGLLTAVNKYDHTRGTRFSTYATWWIRQGITRALSNYGRQRSQALSRHSRHRAKRGASGRH
ncbi:MAG TPA: sigma-70 family RNA polymerase sigma factor [Promineifilum sp.]|nr:sigma-70 family RNA polymerase sigma factor [Promineifilum sp.]